MTKKGNPYGIIKIEDFTGSGEIALCGKDYVDYSKFGKRGMYLLIKARVEDRYNSGRLSYLSEPSNCCRKRKTA